MRTLLVNFNIEAEELNEIEYAQIDSISIPKAIDWRNKIHMEVQNEDQIPGKSAIVTPIDVVRYNRLA